MPVSYWFQDEAIFDKLVVLSEETLYVANPSAEEGRALVARLEEGEPPLQVLKDEGTSIPLSTITRARWNQKGSMIDVRHGKDGDNCNVDFETPVGRDELAAALSEQLAGFQAKTVEFGPVRASVKPLCIGALSAGLTWLLYHGALAVQAGQEAAIQGRHRGVKRLAYWFMDVAGPTGVLVAGGLVLAITAAVLVKRVGDPPIMTTLSATKQK